MATVNDSSLAVADEYVKAALALAEERGVADEFFSELRDFVTFMEVEEAFGAFMVSPIIEPERRGEVLERTLRGRMSDLLLDTLLVLNRKGRAELIPLFCDRFRLALQRQRNEVEVQVTTAVPLTAELRTRLTQVLSERTGHRPRLLEAIDPNLITGLRVRIEDELLDDSGAGQLQRLREALLERAGHELHSGRLPLLEK